MNSNFRDIRSSEVNTFRHDDENYETNVSQLGDTYYYHYRKGDHRRGKRGGFVGWNEKVGVGRSVSTPDILESEGSSARDSHRHARHAENIYLYYY